jgi:hypothetical protein
MAQELAAQTPFAFIVDSDERKYLNDAFRACTATRSWNALKLTSDWNANVARRATQDLVAGMDMREHSGHSASWTLGQMRSVARKGLQQYKINYLNGRGHGQQ